MNYAAWLLLLVTLLCAFVTYEIFRWSRGLKRGPFESAASLWKGGLTHLSLWEQQKLKEQAASWGIGLGQLALIFAVITVLLAVATVRAFLE